MSKPDIPARRVAATVLRYGLAVLFVGGALVVTLLLPHNVLVSPLFFPAIMLSAWFGGIGPGLLSALLSTVAINYYLLHPIYTLTISRADVPYLLAFFLSALLVSSWSAASRRAEEELRQARNELEIKVAERTAELRRATAELETILDASPVGIALFGRDQTVQRSNPAFERILGWTADEIAGRPIPVPVANQEEWSALAERLNRGEAFANVETRLLRKDGSVFDAAVACAPVQDEAGRPARFVGTIQDISDRKRAEEALRRSEVYLAEAQRLSHTGSWALNVATRELVHWSQELYRMYGFDPARGLPSFEAVIQRIYPEDRARALEIFERAVRERTEFEVDFRVVLPNGTLKYIHSVGHPVFNASGDVVEFVGTAMDVTERKRAEEERERLLARERAARAEAVAAQRRFRDLVNSVEGIVWEADAETFAFSFVNEQVERILGYPIEPWLNEPTFWKDHLHPDDRDWAIDFRLKATAENRNHDFEYRMIAANGHIVWLRDLVTVGVEGDRVTKLRGVMVDITQRKQAEETLREQANLLNLTHDTVFVRDMKEVITYWNRGAEELYQWTREEAVGKVSHQLTQTIFPAPIEEINAELLCTGRWEGELVHTRRDGTQVVVASRWALQRDESGNPVAVLETNNDITERKRAEGALHKAQAELAHVTRVMAMGELATSIAHEVNQPLAAVTTNGSACLRWLAGEPPNLDEARECLRRIIRQGNRASEVIVRIRALVKKSVLAKARLDLSETIQEVLAMTNTEARWHRVSVRTELAARLPAVRGDRVQLQQVVLNLVMNGIEAMKAVTDRPRELLISSQPHGSDKVLVAVQDSGIGLDPQSMERLFEAFYTTKPEGMGMGLSISRSIIEAHGGRLWPAANGDYGATFQFTLPTDEGDPHG